MKLRVLCTVTFVAICVSQAPAQFDSGSDGSDGAFIVEGSMEIDLSLAATAPWDTPSPIAGQGVYDPEKWVVVFKYTTIEVQAGNTLTFKNHPSGAPVVWLASGDVSIAGHVILSGAAGRRSNDLPAFAVPGPGGFAGGTRGLNTNLPQSGGFGPGGAPQGGSSHYSGGGGYGTQGTNSIAGDLGGETYGSIWAIPLIGGSGGGGGGPQASGGDAGAGGGAILIASSGAIVLAGNITANGGNGGVTWGSGGSGGTIRLIANSVTGFGDLRAHGGNGSNGSGNGGDGRIRVEAYTVNLAGGGEPSWTMDGDPGPVFPPAGAPVLRATLVDGQSVPADPNAGVQTSDVAIANTNPVTVAIEAANIPAGTTVQVRIVPERGGVIVVESTPLVNVGGGLLTATALVTFPQARSEMQLRANWTP